MRDTTTLNQPPARIRFLHAVAKQPDLAAMSDEQLARFAETENRKRRSRMARLITGRPDRGAMIAWQQVRLPDRSVPVRVSRPAPSPMTERTSLPAVVHVHGGGFVGTAAQSDWITSYLAVHLPAVVISVEHRLLAPGVALSDAVDDGWDVLTDVVRDATAWGIDSDRVAVFGESTGGAVSALSAIRARGAGLRLRAQVLANPCLDVTEFALKHPSALAYADSPTLTRAQLEFFISLAVPPGADARLVSPLHAADLGDLAPALIVVPTIDPIADQARSYAAQLLTAGTPVRISAYPGATHAFLGMPGVVPQAKPARDEILTFLQATLAARPRRHGTGVRQRRG